MHRLTVVLGSSVIDGHVAAQFYLDSGHGKRLIGTLAVPHAEIWLLEHLIESSEQCEEVRSTLESVPRRATFTFESK